MFENEDDFKNIVSRLNIDDKPNDSHRESLRRQMLSAFNETQQKSFTHAVSWQKIRRTIMKSQITKLATAALVVLIAVLGITLLDKSTTVAWAIEDTAEALDQFNALYISGVIAVPLEDIGGGPEEVVLSVKVEKTPFEVWAEANEERTRSGNMKCKTADGKVVVYDNTKTYTYYPNSNTVEIEQGQHAMINPWFSGDFLLKIQEFAEDLQVIYGKDSATGRDRVFVTYTERTNAKSYWFEIDLETSLPVCLKTWNNTRREGPPAAQCERIIYFKDLPDKFFEFEIPEGATVIEK